MPIHGYKEIKNLYLNETGVLGTDGGRLCEVLPDPMVDPRESTGWDVDVQKIHHRSTVCIPWAWDVCAVSVKRR